MFNRDFLVQDTRYSLSSGDSRSTFYPRVVALSFRSHVVPASFERRTFYFSFGSFAKNWLLCMLLCVGGMS